MGQGTAEANRIFELEQKITIARLNNYVIADASTGMPIPISSQRQAIIDAYFKSPHNTPASMQLLNMFEQVNEEIKKIMGF